MNDIKICKDCVYCVAPGKVESFTGLAKTSWDLAMCRHPKVYKQPDFTINLVSGEKEYFGGRDVSCSQSRKESGKCQRSGILFEPKYTPREPINQNKEPWSCEHANEVPSMCPCPPGCYCKENSCRERSYILVEKKDKQNE